ncbi:MAG: apolipoprotein N-acyltransferase [Bacteroidia bacterium]|nr:apolipoprotein N-acyltransferase [Bacteroidia bacterium]MBP7260430.1 apolipoprotein N-acyltransferase [Bacteroidia bacterium]MBP9179752.1 apolipoprotein N-acyltransferase [Bacteroidia bacterium]MBP9724109.1 apolipoprotein N-acyltransferase [Bacteroidia bacterium]
MNGKQHLNYLFLSLSSALLLWLAWPPHHLGWISFIAWVPLLFLLRLINAQSSRKSLYRFMYTFIALVTWNLLCTYWIKNASVFGAIAAAVIVNGLLMPLPLMLYQWLTRKINPRFHLWCFVAPWLLFEFFHLNWELAWPWLTLGNAFANNLSWIQWYEYTGVLGGSFWILTVNYLIYSLLVQLNEFTVKEKLTQTSIIMLSVCLPFLLSYVVWRNYLLHDAANTKQVQVVIVQPNHDPYHEKFEQPPNLLVNEMLQLSMQQVDSETQYLILPETALTDGIVENDNGNTSQTIQQLKSLLEKFPQLHIISGADTYLFYQDKATATARYSKRGKQWYDVFNTALQLNHGDSVQFYHKSKLVPGVERMPYPRIFGFLEDFAIELGGTSGSLGAQDEAGVFTGLNTVAPVICYESIFGNYVADYVRKGAEFICIITNDGWWGNTEGYMQHCAYASLRAIETRRAIARSANTGISCFIDATGQRSQDTDWWEPAVIKGKIKPDSILTFYVRFGDYIGWLALLATMALLINAKISGNKN